MSDASSPIPRRGFFARLLGTVAAGVGLAVTPKRAAADTPYVGEIRMFAGSGTPVGWMSCEGQLLNIASHSALYGLLGTTYGGDGVTTFAIPDLRGRAPIHVGIFYNVLGSTGGSETVTLTTAQIPAHTHTVAASNAAGDSADPAGRVPARNAGGVLHYAAAATTNLAPGALLDSGGGLAHENMQPFLAVRHIISLSGVIPPQL